MTIVAERLLHTVFPALGVGAVMTALILTVLLLPSALVSFLVARKTTRRLETLAKAVGSLREGEYETRVEIVGEDEVAQLQADFNAMADDLTRTMHDLEAQRDTVAQLSCSRIGVNWWPTSPTGQGSCFVVGLPMSILTI